MSFSNVQVNGHAVNPQAANQLPAASELTIKGAKYRCSVIDPQGNPVPVVKGPETARIFGNAVDLCHQFKPEGRFVKGTLSLDTSAPILTITTENPPSPPSASHSPLTQGIIRKTENELEECLSVTGMRTTIETFCTALRNARQNNANNPNGRINEARQAVNNLRERCPVALRFITGWIMPRESDVTSDRALTELLKVQHEAFLQPNSLIMQIKAYQRQERSSEQVAQPQPVVAGQVAPAQPAVQNGQAIPQGYMLAVEVAGVIDPLKA